MDGCRCSQCEGLGEYMRRLTGREYSGLPAAPGHHSSTHGPFTLLRCDGTPTCGCDRCETHRHLLMQSKPRQIRQPWEPVKRGA